MGRLGDEIILPNRCKWMQISRTFFQVVNCSSRGQIQRKPAHAQLLRSWPWSLDILDEKIRDRRMVFSHAAAAPTMVW